MTILFFRGLDEGATAPPAIPWRPAPAPITASARPAGQEPPLRGWGLLREWWRRRRSRIFLCQLDDFLLKDIGVTRAEAEHEVNKPFWLP
jgi:uncharacterized protein YjiS (DUF1127 family)